jgi:hypothetical protein
VGWVAFAAVMMIIVGAFNALTGLVAVFTDDVYVAGARNIVVLDVTTWGWVHIALGIGLVVAGAFLAQGALWARIVATILVMINMFSQMMLLPAYPFWALVIIVVDVLVLWAIVVHGDEKAA